MDHRSYFAYGSNIVASQMKSRCPAASISSTGVLAGYRFRINCRGVATVVRDQDGLVQGVTWLISDVDEAALDRYEGVSLGLYLKTQDVVRLPDAKDTTALIYVATESTRGSPRPGYLESIIQAGLGLGFPSGYIEELRGWLTIPQAP